MISNRRTNIVKGISAGLILLLGLGLYFALRGGFFGDSFPWILVAIIGGVVVLIVSGITMIPRARINKLSRSYEVRADKDYRVYHDKIDQMERDFIPSEKYNKKIGKQAKVCDYCGCTLIENSSVCPNCGQMVD